MLAIHWHPIRMQHWRRPATDGAEFWIVGDKLFSVVLATYKWFKISAPGVRRWHMWQLDSFGKKTNLNFWKLLKIPMKMTRDKNKNAPSELISTNCLALYSCAHSKELFYYSTLLFDGNQAKSMLKWIATEHDSWWKRVGNRNNIRLF